MNKKKIAIITSIVVAVVLLIAGVSYAYYSANIKEVNKTQTVIKTNELSITFTGTQEITAENMIPGDSFTKTFTVENTSNVPVTFNIYMENITNEFDEDLVYVLSDENGVVVDEKVLPETNQDKTYIKTGLTIDAKAIKEYTLKVEFKYLDTPQNDYQNKTFNATLGIDTTPLDIVKVINEKVSFQNLTEGTSITKTFEVKNISDLYQVYDLKLSDITNDYNTNITFNLIKNDEEVLTNQSITGSEMLLLEKQKISGNTTDYYTIIFNFASTVSMNTEGIMLLANDVKKFNAIVEVEFSIDKTEKGGESILSIISKDKSKEGIYNYNVNEKTYSVHTYVYEGNQHWTENMTFGDETDVASASSFANNTVVVKVNGDLTIDSGINVTAFSNSYGGPKGLILYVTGKMINNGTVTMTAKGAKAVGENVYLWQNEDGTYEYVPALGAAGTAVRYSNNHGYTGNPGSNRGTGSGGSGGAYTFNKTATAGAGSQGTSYSGGTGGGSAYYQVAAQSGSANGGAGGAANGSTMFTWSCGGGAGNPGGSGKNGGAAGSNGTGGLLVIAANDLENNGTISSNGSAGGNGYRTGGGGSGGGTVNIFYISAMTNNGKIIANGGAAGLGTRNGENANGGAGGLGTVTYTQIN